MSKLIDEPAFRNRKYVFEDRMAAGHLIAKKLKGLVGKDAIVLAIPAGGVPVGYVVAKELNLPFDVIVVRKIHIPWNPEAGFGAVTWDGYVIFNEPLLVNLGLSEEVVKRCVDEEKKEIKKRLKVFRGEKQFPDLRNKDVLLIDDGLASGYSMLATAISVKENSPKKIIIATPTASAHAIKLVKPYSDMIVCLNVREGFPYAVADAYRSWYDLSEGEVKDYLNL
ncbi:MAG: hypothetical protein L6N94_02265 [Candidatus Methylarchaceae archaeon HK01M]|nr:hypothetical protein [Candidatus Methylarchaceae archaeon HK01M]